MALLYCMLSASKCLLQETCTSRTLVSGKKARWPKLKATRPRQWLYHFPLHFPTRQMADSATELIVAVGTTNPTKINAVKEVLPKVFPQYKSYQVVGVSVRPFAPL